MTSIGRMVLVVAVERRNDRFPEIDRFAVQCREGIIRHNIGGYELVRPR